MYILDIPYSLPNKNLKKVRRKVTLDNVRYSYEKLRVLSFSINHSVCFYYIRKALFFKNINCVLPNIPRFEGPCIECLEKRNKNVKNNIDKLVCLAHSMCLLKPVDYERKKNETKDVITIYQCFVKLLKNKNGLNKYCVNIFQKF